MKRPLTFNFKVQRLQTRLTILILAIAVPVLVVVVTLVISRAGIQMDQDAGEHLRLSNHALAENTATWLDLNNRSLQELVSLPDIISMDPARQRPLLQAMHAAYPEMYLISTTNLKGLNVARNDDEQPKDYSDRQWFTDVIAGAPSAFQSLIGRTTNQPALVVSMPIKDSSNQLVGVGMFAIELTRITEKTKASTVGETGFAYVVDTNNRVVAHPNDSFTAELRDFSNEPPVVAIRNGSTGSMDFTDSAGVRWRTYVDKLENGWGIVVQQREDEVLNAAYTFQHIAVLALSIGALLLLVLSGLVIRRALRPIGSLTETALAIAAGDLKRVAPVESSDEVGTLARTFNSMTSQLRELIDSLEQRVAARTRDLQIAADVSREITTVLDINVLLQQVVSLTAKNFAFYAVFIFLVDEEQKTLISAASANSSGAALKIASIARIPLDAEPSIIAQAARTRQAVTINDVSRSPAYMAIDSLPDTRSELAIPMLLSNRLIGVFDVQSSALNRFGPEDLRLLTALAEQFAIAVRNAQLFAEVESALKTAEQANKVKSQFLASVSHELRTPLNAILNFTQFVATGVLGPVNEEQIDTLNNVLASGRHLLNLINDVLDISKIESGALKLFVVRDINLNKHLEWLAKTAEPLLAGKTVKLALDIDQELPLVIGDERRIRQILLNLVSNACKFTEQGTVTIGAHRQDANVLFYVRDTGPGIAPEDQGAIFDVFYQSEAGVRHGEGTGLGLPISRRLAEAHGGRLWLESTPGQGSTFYVSLPIESEILVPLIQDTGRKSEGKDKNVA